MRTALQDMALLGRVLEGASWLAWRVLLVALCGEPLTDDERAIFRDLTGRLMEPGVRVDEFWAIVGRRGGKSRAMAVLIVYIAVFIDHSSVLVAGERPVVVCLAPSTKQAQIVLSYVVGIIESVPLLAKLIVNRTTDGLELSNGIAIEIRAASFRGIRGMTAVAILGDEACFWHPEDSGSANPDFGNFRCWTTGLGDDGRHARCHLVASRQARRGV